MSAVALTPLVVDPPAATKGIFSYPVGSSIKTVGGLVNVYPAATPLVTPILTI